MAIEEKQEREDTPVCRIVKIVFDLAYDGARYFFFMHLPQQYLSRRFVVVLHFCRSYRI